MKCEWVQENVVLYVYDELPDDARHELEQHVARCATCMAEVQSVKAFRIDMAKSPVQEPSPNFLTDSRMKLQEALESAEQGGWFSRLVFEPVNWLNQVRFAPALAAAIFIVGFAGGIGATYKMVKNNAAPIVDQGPKQGPAIASVSGVSSIAQQPGSNQVTIKYDTVVPQQATGSFGDPQIQQLLLYAARNNFNPGVRMDSVNLLTQQPTNEHVRDALLYALRYDSNTGVRLKALDGLGPYVRSDTQVRDAVLEALMSDANPGIRIEALRLLDPVRADSSVRIVLQRLAQKDENRYIRSQARAMVAQMPDMN
ncbi:MAG TPA: HEAT repeat domain-containing protein [Terriglobales bacterium]|nr:HEAT repeat domain-containing protein [Terriglobales bacterium]